MFNFLSKFSKKEESAEKPLWDETEEPRTYQREQVVHETLMLPKVQKESPWKEKLKELYSNPLLAASAKQDWIIPEIFPIYPEDTYLPGYFKKHQAKVSEYKNPLPLSTEKRLIISERLWGVRIGNEILYDFVSDTVRTAVERAQQLPSAEVVSDTVLNFYADGSRAMIEDKGLCLCQNPISCPIDFDKAARLFPDCKDMIQKLSTMNWKKTPLGVDNRVSRLFFVAKTQGYQDFRFLGFDFSDMFASNLREIFAFLVKKAKEDANYTSVDLSFRDENFEEQTVLLGIGHSDLSYEQALLVTNDVTQLRQSFVSATNEPKFSFNGRGDQLYQGGIFQPLEIMERWAVPYTEEEKSFLLRKRNFKYDLSVCGISR